eukprot:m.250086 g.250086  ORF g.250086 m.250086 type:complete len:54 (-) comp19094_c0_seq6:1014-1175(-)
MQRRQPTVAHTRGIAQPKRLKSATPSSNRRKPRITSLLAAAQIEVAKMSQITS